MKIDELTIGSRVLFTASNSTREAEGHVFCGELVNLRDTTSQPLQGSRRAKSRFLAQFKLDNGDHLSSYCCDLTIVR